MSIDKIRNIGLDKLVTQVYDFDSLTTDELLCKFAQKINIIIEHLNYIDDRSYNSDKALELKLQYLLGQGLEEQVAKRLLELINDGTLENLINKNLLNDIKGQLNAKATTVFVETTNKILDDKINEVATKGTTTQVIENITRQEIERQISNGTIANMTIENNSITSYKLKYKHAKILENEAITVNFTNMKLQFIGNIHCFVDKELIQLEQWADIDLSDKGINGTGVLYLGASNNVEIATLYPNTVPDNAIIIGYVYDDGNASSVIFENMNSVKIIGGHFPQKANIPDSKSVTQYQLAYPRAFILQTGKVLIDFTNNKIIVNQCNIICENTIFSINNTININIKNWGANGTGVIFFDGTTINIATLFPNTFNPNYVIAYVYKDENSFYLVSSNDKAFIVKGVESDNTVIKIGELGDSLTYNANSGRDEIRKIIKCEIDTNAIIGSCVAQNSGAEVAFVDRYLNTPIDCDVIIIEGTTNDCGSYLPIGEIKNNNFDKTTVIGAYQTIIEGYLKRNPNVRLLLVTPTPFWRYGDGRPFASEHINYINAIKEVANYYKLPCLDLYNNSGLNELTKDSLTLDLLHYKEAFDRRIGRMKAEFIKANY